MILLCDVDGTFWQHSDTDFLQYNKNIEAVRRFRAAGNIFGFATGRGVPSMERNFLGYKEVADYLITDNGSFITKVQENRIIDTITYRPEELKRMIQIATEMYPDNRMKLSYHGYDQEYRFPISLIGKVRMWLLDESLIDPLCEKILTELGSHSVKLHHERHAISSSLPWVGKEYKAFINATPYNSGKEEAISKLIKAENLQERIVVLGDDLNDLAMIERFEGYAMRDSHPKVLEKVPEDHLVDNPEELINKLLSE